MVCNLLIIIIGLLLSQPFMGSKPEDNLSASQAILDYMSEAAAGHVEAKHNRFGAFINAFALRMV